MRDDRPNRALLCALLLAPLAAVARDARAGAFVGAKGAEVAPRSERALIVHAGGKQTLIEEVFVRSTAREGLWLEALPSKPRELRRSETKALQALQALTIAREPYNDAIRRSLFGPSVVTLLTHRLIGDPPPAPEDPAASARKLELGAPAVFGGPVTTSTITQRAELPGGLVELVKQYGGTISPRLELDLASYLNRGWVVVATPFRDEHPSDKELARLGPLYAELDASLPVYPIGPFELGAQTHLDLFLLTPSTMVPLALEATWDPRPWEPKELGTKDGLHITYNRPLGDNPELEVELRERGGLTVPPELRVLHGELTLSPGHHADLELVPAKESVTLPASGGRGTAADLFACVVLGLTPLLYTPESWFLLWLGARARSRARRTHKPVALHFWSLYAIGVGLFWFLTLEGTGRAAAIIPALLGVAQLALPYVERDPLPVRAQFRRKRATKA